MKHLEAFSSLLLTQKPARRVLLVALSGGADSVALLRAAVERGPALGWAVEALHCDHGLRGRQSDTDRVFVQALCARLKVPLQVYQKALGHGAGLEERARDWRRLCYARAAKERKASLVLLAHHQRDQAETLLLNLVRGTGKRGAAGMAVLTPLPGAGRAQLARPWLGVDPADLRVWLKKLRQPWREDASNRDAQFARNAIRLKVLPALVAINPRALDHLAAFAGDLAPEKARTLENSLGLDRAARARAQALLAKGHGQVDLGAGWTLKASAGQARLEKDFKLMVGPVRAWKDWSIQLKRLARPPRKWDDSQGFWFAAGLLKDQPRIRAAQAGDRFRPFGFKGSRLVFDQLAEAQVPAWERPNWPVLETRQGIVAVLGVRRGQGLESLQGPGLFLTWKR